MKLHQNSLNKSDKPFGNATKCAFGLNIKTHKHLQHTDWRTSDKVETVSEETKNKNRLKSFQRICT